MEKTALIYAYRTKDAKEINLAYQVDAVGWSYQCDFGKLATAHVLREFKKGGGIVKVIQNEKELVLSLDEHKVLVLPVPQDLIKDWGLVDLVN